MILRSDKRWLPGPGLLLCAIAVLCLVSCRQPENRTFSVRGVVQEIKPGGHTAVIRHDAIPGYMEVMTMVFDVKTANELANVRPGDEIEFRLWQVHQIFEIHGPGHFEQEGRPATLFPSGRARCTTDYATIARIFDYFLLGTFFRALTLTFRNMRARSTAKRIFVSGWCMSRFSIRWKGSRLRRTRMTTPAVRSFRWDQSRRVK